MALYEHFRDTGGVAEVAVDLERRVGTEQVLINAAAILIVRFSDLYEVQEIANELVGAPTC